MIVSEEFEGVGFSNVASVALSMPEDALWAAEIFEYRISVWYSSILYFVLMELNAGVKFFGKSERICWTAVETFH